MRIALVQTVAFLVLEGAERAAANIPPVALSPRIVGVGIAVQVVLACATALALTLIIRAGTMAAEVWLARLTPPRTDMRVRVRVVRVVVPRPAVAGAYHARAPPFSSR